MSAYRALLSLKASISADSDSVLSSWTPNTSHCTWAGVTCDPRRHITSLDLSGLNLFGISADIAKLVYVANLTLADNQLSGPIPPEILAISGLRLLNLSNNVFNRMFPPELSKLTSLHVLDLYNNLIRDLPMLVTQMTNLFHLHLGSNLFFGQIPLEYGGDEVVCTWLAGVGVPFSRGGLVAGDCCLDDNNEARERDFVQGRRKKEIEMKEKKIK